MSTKIFFLEVKLDKKLNVATLIHSAVYQRCNWNCHWNDNNIFIIVWWIQLWVNKWAVCFWRCNNCICIDFISFCICWCCCWCCSYCCCCRCCCCFCCVHHKSIYWILNRWKGCGFYLGSLGKISFFRIAVLNSSSVIIPCNNYTQERKGKKLTILVYIFHLYTLSSCLSTTNMETFYLLNRLFPVKVFQIFIPKILSVK